MHSARAALPRQRRMVHFLSDRSNPSAPISPISDWRYWSRTLEGWRIRGWTQQPHQTRYPRSQSPVERRVSIAQHREQGPLAVRQTTGFDGSWCFSRSKDHHADSVPVDALLGKVQPVVRSLCDAEWVAE